MEREATQPVVEQGSDGQFRLLVLRGDHVETHGMPSTGPVTIGRSGEVDIHVDDVAISRRHATVHMGTLLRVEDLGSVNGTRLNGQKLTPHTPTVFAPGDLIDMGATVILVQPRTSSLRPRRIWTHDYFEGRIEEECARGHRRGTRFTVVRLHVEGAAEPGLHEEVLTAALRTEDCCSIYGPNEYEMLLLDTDRLESQAVIERLRQRFAQHRVQCTIGTATFPDDGQSPEQLIDVACAAVFGASAPTGPLKDEPIIQGDAMRRLYGLIDRIADSPLSVLLQGETGVGKEVVAEAVHRRSNRAEKPFVRINCAAFAETLFESELFGYEKGAFSGATQNKPGLIESAHGGSLFLDEIGEMPLTLQAKLLRALETREVMRVGSLKARAIDVRFIAATNNDLETRSASGLFRQDLYFRLNGITLHIPPLRERVSEIPGLVALFLKQACALSTRKTPPRVTDEAIEILQRYRWPGNVRELRNLVVRALLLCGSAPSIGIEHLPLEKMSTSLAPRKSLFVDITPARVKPQIAPGQPTEDRPSWQTNTQPIELKPKREAIDRVAVLRALEKTGGNQSRAAELLGISRRTMVTRIKELGIARPRDNE